MPDHSEPMMSPFSNGTDFMIWKFDNCDRCALGYSDAESRWPCTIEHAMDVAYIGNGDLPVSVAERIGRQDGGRLNERCAEFKESK